MASHSTASTDGLGGEKIIYNHFSLKPQKFPLLYQLRYKANLQPEYACQVHSSRLWAHDGCLATLVSMVVKNFLYLFELNWQHSAWTKIKSDMLHSAFPRRWSGTASIGVYLKIIKGLSGDGFQQEAVILIWWNAQPPTGSTFLFYQ